MVFDDDLGFKICLYNQKSCFSLLEQFQMFSTTYSMLILLDKRHFWIVSIVKVPKSAKTLIPNKKIYTWRNLGSGHIMLGYPPFWQILTKWRGGSQAQFFQKKSKKFFTIFSLHRLIKTVWKVIIILRLQIFFIFYVKLTISTLKILLFSHYWHSKCPIL